MNKLFLLVPATAAAVFLTGCVDEPYYGRVANDGPGYYGRDAGPAYGPGYGPGPDYRPGPYDGGYGPDDYGPGGEVDFYYVGGVPYSRSYGPLVFRGDRYYFRRGGALASYDVDAGRRRSFRRGGSGAGGRGGRSDGGGRYSHGNGGQQYHGQMGTAGGGNGRTYSGNDRTLNGRGTGRFQGGGSGDLHVQAHGPGTFQGRPGGVQGRPGVVGQQHPAVVPQKGGSQKKKDDH